VQGQAQACGATAYYQHIVLVTGAHCALCLLPVVVNYMMWVKDLAPITQNTHRMG
jgi:hypothetical protein